MASKKDILDLVSKALEKSANFAVLEIGVLPEWQAKEISKYVKEDITGAVRVIDTNGICHALKEHGSETRERNRGQIAVSIDDFMFVPKILKEPDSIKYVGKNKLKQDIFLYEKRIGNLYFVAEAVRFSKKKGNKLVALVTKYR